MNLERALATPGFTSPTKLLWLAQQARRAQVVVEIGSWMGRSTRALADNCPGVVYAVDDWRGPENSPGAAQFDEAFDAFRANCADLIESGKVVPLRVASPSAAEKFRELVSRPIDLLFIDGLHTRAAVRADLAAWAPLLAPGALLCGDDFNPAWSGVMSAVRESLQTYDVVPGTDLWFTRRPAPRLLPRRSQLEGTRLYIATPAAGGKNSTGYTRSLVETGVLCARSGVDAVVQFADDDSLITRARSGLASDFFKGDCDPFVFVDADLEWRAADLLRLVACPAGHDVVCGVYPQRGAAPGEPVKWPVAFLSADPAEWNICKECGAIEILEGPTGFMAVRRAAFERIAAQRPELACEITDHMAGWAFFNSQIWARGLDGDVAVAPGNGLGAVRGGGGRQFKSEDFSFCRLLRSCGGSVWMLPDIPFLHGGQPGCLDVWLREEPVIPTTQAREEALCAQ